MMKFLRKIFGKSKKQINVWCVADVPFVYSNVKNRSNPTDIVVCVYGDSGNPVYLHMSKVEFDNSRNRATILLGLNQSHTRKQNG